MSHTGSNGASATGSERKRTTVLDVLRAKASNAPPLTMLTAYDACFARMVDEAGVDIILVGDSLGMVVQGRDTTLQVTMDEMIYHCSMVSRVAEYAHIVGDLPFMSYQVSDEEAVRNSGRLIAEGGAHSVKLEGGSSSASAIKRIVAAGIPVMGHIGLTPQRVHQLGGFKVQGKTEDARQRLIDDASAVEAAGAYAVVLECIPASLAAEITGLLNVPTIGIGAGPHCDGQILNTHDMLGLTPTKVPRFVKQYGSLYSDGVASVGKYLNDVRSGVFPAATQPSSGAELKARDGGESVHRLGTE